MSPEKPQPVFVRCYIENPGGDATRSAPRPVAYQRRPPRARNRPSYVAARLTGFGAAEPVVPQLVAPLVPARACPWPERLCALPLTRGTDHFLQTFTRNASERAGLGDGLVAKAEVAEVGIHEDLDTQFARI